ncbi:MAG TPA: phosphoribosylamine--glycine ligase [Candidatus Eisenbacteria bacterium]
MSAKRILVVGAGGREHALAWRLARDPERPEVVLAPGNAGAARRFPCWARDPSDPAGVISLARERAVDLVVIGPEAPLAAGLADALAGAGLAVFGPPRQAARLETSKWFAKEVLREAGAPTARAEAFTDANAARSALARFTPPYVIKADGIAAGKGVRVTPDLGEAGRFIADCLEARRFGAAGSRVLIEEFLPGEEASVMAVCDGERFLLLPPARDYKRAQDGDRGPNTGGMGSLAPAPTLGAALEDEIGRRIVGPVLEVMARRRTPFRGVLYCGLVIEAGAPRVLEFNVRFGDPEAQVVLPLVEGSLSRLLASAAGGRLERDAVTRGRGAAVAVAITDRDYPDSHSGEGVIEGLDEAEEKGEVTVFHAGTERAGGAWRVSGGRAAHVMAHAGDLETARARVYDAIDALGGHGFRFRRDIAAGVSSLGAAAAPSLAGGAGSRR